MEKLISQFKALPQWQRFSILIVSPIALTALLWFMQISPVMEEIKKTREEIEKVKIEINNIRASIDHSLIENLKKQEEELKTELNRKEEELKKLVGEIPKEGEIGTLFRNIGRIAKRSGVNIFSMQASPPQAVSYAYIEGVVKEIQQQQEQQKQAQQTQQATPLQSVNFMKSELKLSLMGSYVSIENFIVNLEREGILSYPVYLSLKPEGDRVRAEITIHLLMKGGET